jgi:hypothetical protein
MTGIMINCEFGETGINDYRLGGNLCNAFAMGEIGAEDDFFLVGCPANDEDSYPILTGNFLDSEGNHLFRLVRNVLQVNARNCSKIIGNQIGFGIHDGVGKPMISVRTTSQTMGGRERLITEINGTFYGKNGSVMAAAHNGALIINPGTKHLIGLPVGYGAGYNEMESQVALACLTSGGVAHQLLTGNITNKTIELDGKLLLNITITSCIVKIRTGKFTGIGTNITFDKVRFDLEGEALNLAMLINSVRNCPSIGGRTKEICKKTGRYTSVFHEHQEIINLSSGDEFPTCPKCNISIIWGETN